MTKVLDELLEFHGWTDAKLARKIAALTPGDPLEAAEQIMDVLGPNYDSYDRELSFDFHSRRLACSYDKIYDAWLAQSWTG